MYKFIQRKQKLLLAIFGVILMIAFIVPVGVNQFSDGEETRVVGHVGDKPLTNGEVRQARRDLEVLIQARFGPLMQLGETMFGGGEAQVAAKLRDDPRTYALLQREAREAGVVASEDAVTTLFGLYFQQRATKAEDVAGYRGVIERFLLVRNNYQRVLADLKITQPMVRSAIAGTQQPTVNIIEFKAADYLAEAPSPSEEKVVAHYNQYATVTPSPVSPFAATQPVQFGYRQPDKLKVQYLELPASQLFDIAIKGLTAVDLLPLQRVAFAYYNANQTEFTTTENPATAPGSQPTTAPGTQPSTTPATQPSTGPATASATAPATTPATSPATGPTTRPFADVRQDIQRRVLLGEITAESAPTEDVVAAQMLRQRVEAKAQELRTALHERLLQDYRAASGYNKVGPTTRAAGASLGDIEKLDYLEKVATEFEKAHGIRPTVKSLANEWLTIKDLSALPGIGSASASGMRFPQFATRHSQDTTPEDGGSATQPSATQPSATQPATTQPSTTQAAQTLAAATQPSTQLAQTNPVDTQPATVPSTQPAGSTATVKPTTAPKPALALFEPSPILTDTSGNAYIFRLTAFQGEHVPALDAVREQIVKDLKLVAAYELARKQASTVREAAGSAATNSDIGGFPKVSDSVNKPVIVVGPITQTDNNRMPEIPGYDVSDPVVQQQLLRGVSLLLTTAKTDQPHPSALIDLPAQQKVLALELRSFERPWPAEEDAQMQVQMIGNARTTLMQDPAIREALLGWFNGETVASRMNYKPAD